MISIYKREVLASTLSYHILSRIHISHASFPIRIPSSCTLGIPSFNAWISGKSCEQMCFVSMCQSQFTTEPVANKTRIWIWNMQNKFYNTYHSTIPTDVISHLFLQFNIDHCQSFIYDVLLSSRSFERERRKNYLESTQVAFYSTFFVYLCFADSENVQCFLFTWCQFPLRVRNGRHRMA